MSFNFFRTNLTSKFWFILHLFITIVAWVAPFFVHWHWLTIIYGAVTLQFLILKTCVVNIKHGLDDSENHTFYAELLEIIGFKVNRSRIKKIVRPWLYLVILVFAIIWQEWVLK
jgi:hypothetical protein